MGGGRKLERKRIKKEIKTEINNKHENKITWVNKYVIAYGVQVQRGWCGCVNESKYVQET